MNQPHFTFAARLGRACRALPLLLAFGFAAPSFAAEPTFDQALQSYRSGEVSDAYGRFLALAQRGNPDAARFVLFLSAYGPLLHGKYWELTERDAAAARALAARSNRGSDAALELVSFPATASR